MGKVTSGFKASTLTNAALIGAGAFGNSFLRQQIAVRLVPQAAAGIPSYLLGLATSGLLLFIPKVGSQLALGGVFGEVYRAARENIPQLKALGMMDDYIDTSSQIGDYIDSSSQIGDFLEAGQLSEYDEDSELGSYWEGNVGAGSQDTPTMGSRSIDASKTFE